jgi:Tfp pilus assembly protein PilF
MSRVFALLFLCAVSYAPASADIVRDCYQTTLERPLSNERIIELCTRAISSSSGLRRASALLNRGVGYMQKGDLEAALRDLSESIRLDPNRVWTFSTRANVYRLKGQYDLALSDLNEILRRDPQFIGAYVDRGMVFRDRGDFLSARSDFETVLGMRGGHPDIEKWARDTAQKELAKLPR